MKEGCTYQVFYFHHHHICQRLKVVLLYGWKSQVLKLVLQGPPRQLCLYIFGRTALEWDNLPTWESKYAPRACQLRGRIALIPDMLTSQIWCRGREGGVSWARKGEPHSLTTPSMWIGMKCDLIIPLAMTARLSNVSHSVFPVPTRTAVCWYSIITSSSFFFFNFFF